MPTTVTHCWFAIAICIIVARDAVSDEKSASFAQHYPATRGYLEAVQRRKDAADVTATLDELRETLARLRGLGITEGRVPRAERDELTALLTKAARTVGVELLPAVIADSRNDVVRQAAYFSLLNYGDINYGYSVAHLPMLCECYVQTFSMSDWSANPLSERTWAGPDTVRTRLASRICTLSGGNVADLYGADDPLKISYQRAHPRKWLVDYLERAFSADGLDEQQHVAIGTSLMIARRAAASQDAK